MTTDVQLWYYLSKFLLDEECVTTFVETIKKHILCPLTFFPENRAVFWDNVDKYGRARHATDDIIRRMRCVCWLTKATDTHSEYVILVAFPRQQWLRYMYSAFLVTVISFIIDSLLDCLIVWDFLGFRSGVLDVSFLWGYDAALLSFETSVTDYSVTQRVPHKNGIHVVVIQLVKRLGACKKPDSS